MPGSENTTEFDIIFNAIYDVNFFAAVTSHCMSTDGVIKHLIIEATEGYACTVGQAFHEEIEINMKMQWKKKSWKLLLKAEKAAAEALATAAAAFTATKTAEDAEGARDALKAAVEAFTKASTEAAHATEDFVTTKKAVRAEVVKERRLAQDPRPLPPP
jgi:flagellar hook-basal body complex protein FliE